MMKKEIKDFLHLYIGCEMEYKTHHEPQDATYILDGKGLDQAIEFEERPILRPLWDMTENEDQIEFPKNNRGEFIDMHWYPEGYVWLLYKGFDLFGLIESGLAIDKTEVEKAKTDQEDAKIQKKRCSEACNWPECTLPGCVIKGEVR